MAHSQNYENEIFEWNEKLSHSEKELGFKEGYKFLYSPWKNIHSSNVAFISLNPGAAPKNISMRELSDERGNSYEIEQTITKSPITDQFLTMCDFLNLKPKDILTGVVSPFRSNNWEDLNSSQKSGSLAIGEEFWRHVVARCNIKIFILCSSEPMNVFNNILDLKLEKKLPSGWGNTSLRRYVGINGQKVIQLPHLSRYKLFSRPECEKYLSEIFQK